MKGKTMFKGAMTVWHLIFWGLLIVSLIVGVVFVVRRVFEGEL